MTGDHGWQGGGRFRVARVDGRLIIRFSGLTTRGGRLKNDLGAFFRKDYRARRPDFRAYDVAIWVEVAEDAPPKRLDVDNVAKACLDALTGAVWQDDSQVVRLSVEKVPGDTSAITLVIGEADAERDARMLTGLLARADELG